MTVTRFTQVIPPKFRGDKFRLEYLNGMRRAGTAARKDLNSTTKFWRGARPTFDQKVSLKRGRTTLTLTMKGSKRGIEKWNRLDKGMDPTRIVPINARVLRFFVPYTAGTTPNTFVTKPAVVGTTVVFSAYVDHPGFPARNWRSLAVKTHRPNFVKQLDESARRAARASRHGVRR